ncbi:MAG: hypothetical protein AAFN77_19925 [Planctomycetota bacterium]
MNDVLPKQLKPLFAAVFSIGLFFFNTASAQDALEKELTVMATDRIIPLVEKRGGGAIAVGTFSAAPSVKGSAGPDVQLKLTSILVSMKAKIDNDDYQYEVTGNYLPYSDPESGLSGVKLIGRLIDAQDGTTLGEFPRFVFGPEAVPRMLGLNVNLRGRTQPKDQSDAIKEAIEKPQGFSIGSQLSSSPASPYAIELLVKSGNEYKPRSATLDSKSRPFVEILQNEVYAIRLMNHSKHEAAVKLTIDGVNVFQFSQQNPKPTAWIVPPKQGRQPGVTIVRGWDQNANESLEFKVTSFPDSAASQVNLRPSNRVGVITAAFSASWADEKDRPRDEGRTRGTGFGEQIVDKKTMVKRHIGHVRDMISVRYEK